MLRYDRFEQTGSTDDLDRAIRMNERAIASTPDDYPNQEMHICMYLVDLGPRSKGDLRVWDRWTTLNERSCRTYEQAFKSVVTPSSVRLQAASSCSNILICHKRYSRAKPILQMAVHILLTDIPRRLSHSDQQFNISQSANISRAVSLHLRSEKSIYIIAIGTWSRYINEITAWNSFRHFRVINFSSTFCTITPGTSRSNWLSFRNIRF
jgi:hypothetical protein